MITVQETYDKLKKVYEAKNHDYGNSFEKSIKKYGTIAALVRMSDKMERLDTLLQGSLPMVQDESAIDTALDLANYAVMLAVYLENRNLMGKTAELYKEAEKAQASVILSRTIIE